MATTAKTKEEEEEEEAKKKMKEEEVALKKNPTWAHDIVSIWEHTKMYAM